MSGPVAARLPTYLAQGVHRGAKRTDTHVAGVGNDNHVLPVTCLRPVAIRLRGATGGDYDFREIHEALGAWDSVAQYESVILF